MAAPELSFHAGFARDGKAILEMRANGRSLGHKAMSKGELTAMIAQLQSLADLMDGSEGTPQRRPQ